MITGDSGKEQHVDRQRTVWRRCLNIASWWLGLVSVAAVGAPVPYTVSVMILPGSCQVDIPQSTVSIPGVDRELLKDGSIQGERAVPVNISACGGVVSPIQFPTLTITGNTVPGAEGANKYLFNEGGEGSAVGYGITLSQESLSSWNEAKLVPSGGDVQLSEEPGPYTDGVATFYVGVGCGQQSDCVMSGLTPGELTAKLTFTFSYK